jgi:intein/homing endonuclease
MKTKKPKPGFEALTEEKARIIAHLIGDGAHFKTNHDYVMKYEVKDEQSLAQFHKDIISVYGLEPTRYQHASGKTGKPIPSLRLRSKIAFDDLHRFATFFSKDWKIKQPVLDADTEIKRQFLKALFDDEGSVKSKREVALYSINLDGLLQVKEMLQSFGISSKIGSGFGQNRNVHAILIRDLQTFAKKVGFGLERKQRRLQEVIEKRCPASGYFS